MGIAVEAPIRDDVSFRTNDDKLLGARWLKSDAATPVNIDTAAMTLKFDPPSGGYVDPRIYLEPDEHRIDSVTPGDPNGWIDAERWPDGVVLVNVPHSVWPQHETRSGTWDLVATGEGIQRCLVRGTFTAEEGAT